MEEILDYILDYIFPRKADSVLDTSSYKKDILATKQDKETVTTQRNTLVSKYNINSSIHNYFEGAVWRYGLIWGEINAKTRYSQNLNKDVEKIGSVLNLSNCLIENKFNEDKLNFTLIYYPILYTGLYDDSLMQELIHRAKFKSEWAIAKQVGQQIGIFLNSLMNQGLFLLSNQIVITYVPPDKNRLNERGFHLPKIISKQAFKEINKYYQDKKHPKTNKFQCVQDTILNINLAEAITKIKNTQRQTKLNKTERQINIQNTFQINIKNIQKIPFLNQHKNEQNKLQNINYKNKYNNSQEKEYQNKTMLWIVIDDVTTTGSTLNEACLTLYNYSRSIGYNEDKVKFLGMCWLYAK